MQELDKFSFKVNVTSNELEKYTKLSFDDKIALIDSSQFKLFIDSLVKN